MFSENTEEYEKNTKLSRDILKKLELAIETYRTIRRLDVVKPFASLFDPTAARDDRFEQPPSHRGLFWAFSYQFSLLGWSDALLDVFKETVKVEKKRRRPRFWTPDWAKFRWGDGQADAAFEDEVKNATHLASPVRH